MVIFFASYDFFYLSSSKFLDKLQKLTDQGKGQKFVHIDVVSEAVHLPLFPPLPSPPCSTPYEGQNNLTPKNP